MVKFFAQSNFSQSKIVKLCENTILRKITLFYQTKICEK